VVSFAFHRDQRHDASLLANSDIGGTEEASIGHEVRGLPNLLLPPLQQV